MSENGALLTEQIEWIHHNASEQRQKDHYATRPYVVAPEHLKALALYEIAESLKRIEDLLADASTQADTDPDPNPIPHT